MRIRELVAGLLALVPVGARAEEPCHPDVQEGCDDPPVVEPSPLVVAVDRAVDMVDDYTMLGFGTPVDARGGALLVDDTAVGFAELGVLPFRMGKRAGTLELLPADFLLAFSNDVSFAFHGAIGRARLQYLCFDETRRSYTLTPPGFEVLPDGVLCRAGEGLGYYATLGDLSVQTATGTLGLRLGELGVGYNFFRTGRTVSVKRNELLLRAGAAVDYVDFGAVPLPTGNPATDWMGRGAVRLALGGSTDDRRFRARLEGSWEPRFGFGDDHVVRADAEATLYFELDPENVIALGASGAFVHATVPSTALGHWLGRGDESSFRAGLRLSYYWGFTTDQAASGAP